MSLNIRTKLKDKYKRIFLDIGGGKYKGDKYKNGVLPVLHPDRPRPLAFPLPAGPMVTYVVTA